MCTKVLPQCSAPSSCLIFVNICSRFWTKLGKRHLMNINQPKDFMTIDQAGMKDEANNPNSHPHSDICLFSCLYRNLMCWLLCWFEFYCFNKVWNSVDITSFTEKFLQIYLSGYKQKYMYFQMVYQKYLFILMLFVISPSQKLWTTHVVKTSFLSLKIYSLENND